MTTNTEINTYEHPFYAEISEYKEAGYHPDYCLSLFRWCLWNKPELAEELKRGRELEENWLDYDLDQIEQQMAADYKRVFDVARSIRDQYDQNWIIANAFN